MTELLYHLFYCEFEGDLSKYLLREEERDYKSSREYWDNSMRELKEYLSQVNPALFETIDVNCREVMEIEHQLSFRRGLVLGLRLGMLGAWK